MAMRRSLLVAAVAALVLGPMGVGAQPPAHVGRGKKVVRPGKVKVVKAPAKKKPSKKELKLRQHMRFANFLSRIEGDQKAAAAEFNKAIRVDRKHVPAYRGLAGCYVAQKDYKKALKALERLTRLEPKEVGAWIGLAKVHELAGQPEKALAAYEKVLSVSPNHAVALGSAGDIVYAQFAKSHNAALKGRVLGLYKSFLKSNSLQKGRQAQQIERRVVEMEGGAVALAFFDAKMLYQQAFVQWRRMSGMLDNAYTKLDSVLQARPKDREALYYQGLIHLSIKSKKLHNVAKGLAKLKEAGAYAPALAELGRYYRMQDDLEKATTNLQQAVKLDARNQRALYELGLVHKLAGRNTEAKELLRKAIDVDRRSDVAGRCVVELSILDPTDARVMWAMRTAKMDKGDLFNTEKFKAGITVLEGRLGGIDEDSSEQVWLDVMMRRLLRAAEVDPAMHFEVKVAKTKMVNAFAAPNGNIYFTRGFLDLIKKNFPDLPLDGNNSAIAAVMGHEITHVTKSHVVRSMIFQDALKSGGFQPSTIVTVTTVTRTHEIEADREGMRLMFLAGYDPRMAVEVHRVYGANLGEIPNGLTHPTFDERIHYLEEYWSNEMAFAYASYHQGVDKLRRAAKLEAADLNKAAALYRDAVSDFKRFTEAFTITKEAMNNLGLAQAKLGLFHMAKMNQKSPLARWFTEFAIEPDLALKFRPLLRRAARAADPAAVPRSIRAAKTSFETALKKDPEYARALMNLGVVHLAIGEFGDAEKRFQMAAASCEKNKACGVDPGKVDNLIGIAKAEQGRAKEAIAAFRQSLRLRVVGEKRPPMRLFNLARAMEKDGDKSGAKETYRKFIREAGDIGSPWVTEAKASLQRLEK